MGTFLQYVGSKARDATLRSSAADAYATYQSSIIANYSTRNEHGTGLSIYLPAQGTKPRTDYTGANFLFAADTHWDEFLVRYTSKAGPQSAKASVGAKTGLAHAGQQVALDWQGVDLVFADFRVAWMLI
jgi:hypothetical protein